MTTTLMIACILLPCVIFFLNWIHSRTIARLGRQLLIEMGKIDAENTRKNEEWKREIEEINRDHERRIALINRPEKWN